jgi:NAD(P)-dependent dehydrogenase (short-subunit alcohol dehydrogenase family)
MNSIKEEMGASTAGKVEWIKCDLTQWTEVAEAASKISKNTDKTHILINDAARGIMTYQLTSYGVDEHIALNHIGHVILNSHLLPILKKTSEADKVRIVTLGSNLHESAPSDTKFASLDEINTDLGPNKQYARSELAVMLYARYLAMYLLKTHPNIFVNCVHPSIVETAQSTKHIHEAYPVGGFAMSVGLNPLKKDQFMGAVSTMFAATKTMKTGQYICPPAMLEQGSKLYNSDTLMENLTSLTKQIVKDITPEANLQGCPLEFY